jgi:hypothetical protein
MITTDIIFTVFKKVTPTNKTYYSVNPEYNPECAEKIAQITHCNMADAIDIAKTVSEELEFHLNNSKKFKDDIIKSIWFELERLPDGEATDQVLIDFLNLVTRMNR